MTGELSPAAPADTEPEEPATTAIPAVEPEDDASSGDRGPETTVVAPVDPEPADEPETALFAPVTPPAAEPAGASSVQVGAAPQDAAAAPPLEVLGVQPDGTVLPAPDPNAPVGVEPGSPPPDEPGFRERGRLRRRLRYLRRVRELGLRDLGGLVFDLHRFAREGELLVTGKLSALDGVDREVRELEEALDDRRELVVLREPGLSACPRCAALHGSDANFCPNCGLPFSGGSPATGPGPAPTGSLSSPPVPGPSSVTATHVRVERHGPTLPPA